MNILNAARPRTPQLETPPKASSGSFIEDVELWVKKYLNLADEALQSPAEPRGEDEESAA